MNERFIKLSKLIKDVVFRKDYTRAKLSILIPSQIRALRGSMTQSEFAEVTGMKQSRISAMETPGAVNFNLDTLVRIAAGLKIGLQVRFVTYSQMLDWENSFSQDDFTVTKIDDDQAFLSPNARQVQNTIEMEPLSRNIPAREAQAKDANDASAPYFPAFLNLANGSDGDQRQWMN